MKNDPLNQIISYAKHIKLSEQEKGSIRTRIESHMRFTHAIREQKRAHRRTLSPWRYLANSVAFALIVLIIGGGTLTYAAQDTVPGHVLYPLKVRVAEPIEETLAVRPETKAIVQAKQVSRRIEEARTLVETNKFSPEKQEFIEKELDKKVERLATSINTLADSGKVDKALAATAKLQPALEVQKELITEISNAENQNNEQAPVMAMSAEIALFDTAEESTPFMAADAPATRSLPPADNSKKAQAEKLLAKLEKTLSDIDTKEQEILARVDTATKTEQTAKRATETQSPKIDKPTLNPSEASINQYNTTLANLTNVRKEFERQTRLATATAPVVQSDSLEDDDLSTASFTNISIEIDDLTQSLNLEEAAFLLEEALADHEAGSFRAAIEKITAAQKLIERVNLYLQTKYELSISNIDAGASVQASQETSTTAEDEQETEITENEEDPEPVVDVEEDVEASLPVETPTIR